MVRTPARNACARRGALHALLLLVALLLPAAAAHASVVRHGYLPLSDGTELNYTLTLPSADGRYPVVLQYDPYSAGATSDPSWNKDGYAMLGVNMRGTECSGGVFRPLRADIWGADGAQVVDWVAKQPWSDGSVGMIGYSFTGTSQLATAEYAGSALKAITPGNVFPDFYRDMIYPGGIHNGWIPLWIVGRDYILGSDSAKQAPTDPHCAADLLGHLPVNAVQTLDTQDNPFIDDYWSRDPLDRLDRIHIPVLGCVDWQDTTVYSRAFDTFRDRLAPDRTWLMGSNGSHGDCANSHTRMVRFFDRYLKGRANGWESTPHVILAHEVGGTVGEGARGKLGDDAGAWQTSFRTWSDMAAAITPLTLHLHAGGLLDLAAPGQAEPADSYVYPRPTTNTPGDFLTVDHWAPRPSPDGQLTYTTPPLAGDAEFLGDGSLNLWVASTATDSDVQLTISEVRPDGQELYVENGWLRLSHRKLDEHQSTALRPYHTDLEADREPLTPGQPVLARISVLPFDHVFRAGSSIRLSIDAPGGYFQIVPQPATNTVFHQPGMDSQLVLGRVATGVAHGAQPACGSLLNQPCRPNATPVPTGSLALPAPAPAPVTLRVGRVSGLAAARRGHPFMVTARVRDGALRGARLVLRDRRGRVVGRSRAFRLDGRARHVAVAVGHALRAGRYTLTLTGRAPDGSRVSAARAVRVSARARSRRG